MLPSSVNLANRCRHPFTISAEMVLSTPFGPQTLQILSSADDRSTPSLSQRLTDAIVDTQELQSVANLRKPRRKSTSQICEPFRSVADSSNVIPLQCAKCNESFSVRTGTETLKNHAMGHGLLIHDSGRNILSSDGSLSPAPSLSLDKQQARFEQAVVTWTVGRK